MSKIRGLSLALTTALVAIPTLLSSASAAPVVHSDGYTVYDTDGTVLGRDPDPSIRAMILRDAKNFVNW